jgi:drug/metabolite transporter (DMT)-like permease
MTASVLFGMAAAVAASAMYNVAIALQALEARDVPEEHGLRPALLLKLLRRPRWLAGAALNFLGWPMQTVALLLAPLTLVQPCLAAGLLLLLLVGSRHLHEPVGRREVLSIAAIVAGVGVLALAAPHRSNRDAGPETLAIVLGILGLVTLLPYLLSRLRRIGGLPVAISAGFAFSWSGISTKLLSDALHAGDWVSIVGWAAATGIAAAVGTASEMTALQSRGATEVAPLVFVTQLLVPALLAPVLVHEAWSSTPLGGIVLLGGLLLVAAGSALLASSRVVARFTAGIPAPDTPQTFERHRPDGTDNSPATDRATAPRSA